MFTRQSGKTLASARGLHVTQSHVCFRQAACVSTSACVRSGEDSSAASSPPSLNVYTSDTNDPFFNLAIEDWLFRNGDPHSQSLFLWRNSPTIVIGRNQNPYLECHLEKMKEEGVELTRRQSGGGAVYQDLGNTCFTFLSPRDDYLVSRNMGIITRALRNGFDIDAVASGRNDIEVNGAKISGSAFKLNNRAAFHHGTLLLNVDLSALGRLLNPSKKKMESKGVKSVKARVLNLQDINEDIDHHSVCEAIMQEFFAEYGSTCEVQELKRGDLDKDDSLREYYQQLRNNEWRFGLTPQFTHHLDTRFPWASIDVMLETKRNKVLAAHVYSDHLDPDFIDVLQLSLQDISYDAAGMQQAYNTALASPVVASSEDLQAHLAEFRTWLTKEISA